MFKSDFLLTRVSRPVLDPATGEVAATLSLSDLKGSYRLLYDSGAIGTVGSFLKDLHSQAQSMNHAPPHSLRSQAHGQPLCVSPDETVREAVRLMLANRIHR